MSKFSRMITRSNERATLFSRMIETLGVDIVPATAANETAVGSAIRGCLACAVSAECRRFLDRRSAGAVGEAPAFCPNRDLVRSMPRHT